MAAYLLGIATVFALAYVAVGVYLAVEWYQHERPSNWVHNGPPGTWNWARRDWVFWLVLVILPVLWPPVVIVLRLNSRWNRRKWSRMSMEQRGVEYARFQASFNGQK